MLNKIKNYNTLHTYIEKNLIICVLNLHNQAI